MHPSFFELFNIKITRRNARHLVAAFFTLASMQAHAVKNSDIDNPLLINKRDLPTNQSIVIQASIEELKSSVKNIVDVDHIAFYESFALYDVAVPEKTINIISEKQSDAPGIRLDKNDKLFASALQCSIIVPSPAAVNLNAEAREFYRYLMLSSSNESETDAYLFIAYHEATHCFSSMMLDQDMNLTEQLTRGFDERETPARRYDIKTIADETVSDTFAALKMQQRYYALNKSAINNNELPLIAPILERAANYRKERTTIDPLHNTSGALNGLIAHIRKPGQMALLENAKTDQLLITAYHVLAVYFGDAVHIVDNAYPADTLTNAEPVKNYLPSDYSRLGVNPVFDLGASASLDKQ